MKNHFKNFAGILILVCQFGCTEPEEEGTLTITAPSEFNMHNSYSPGDSIQFSITRKGKPFDFLDLSLIRRKYSAFSSNPGEIVSIHNFQTFQPVQKIKDNQYSLSIKIPEETSFTPDGHYEELILNEEGRETNSYSIFLGKFKKKEDIPKLQLVEPQNIQDLQNKNNSGDSILLIFSFSGERIETIGSMRIDLHNNQNGWVQNQIFEVNHNFQSFETCDSIWVKHKIPDSLFNTPENHSERLSIALLTQNNTGRMYSFDLGRIKPKE